MFFYFCLIQAWNNWFLQCKSWVIAKETIWPTKPQMFTVWLVENVYQFQFRETWWDFTLVRQFYWELHHFHFSLLCMGEGNGNPLQCSCLEHPRDRGAWWAAVYGVAQSQTWLKWLSSCNSRYLWGDLRLRILPRKHSPGRMLLILCVDKLSSFNSYFF